MPNTNELRGVPLLREVLKTIDEKPDEWDQGVWGKLHGCGTAMRVAGWACVLAGFPLNFVGVDAVRTMSGESIALKAEELLGIDEETSDNLFLGSNDREDIQEIAERIAADMGETL